MNDDTVIVGIDNGISGGLCAVAAFDGAVLAYRAMPIKKTAKTSEVDIPALLEWLEPYRKNMIVLDVQDADVMCTFDGSAPTSTNGHRLYSGYGSACMTSSACCIMS